MGGTPKTALAPQDRATSLHRCINLCKVAKSPSALCSLLPAPCSLFQQLILLLSDYLDNC
ncbi:MAG: hypothetical protein F6K65_06575 [Moorea sp. SIO3C2]|nr:hypothetical protein [Moorena sp. SIO3C2]